MQFQDSNYFLLMVGQKRRNGCLILYRQCVVRVLGILQLMQPVLLEVTCQTDQLKGLTFALQTPCYVRQWMECWEQKIFQALEVALEMMMKREQTCTDGTNPPSFSETKCPSSAFAYLCRRSLTASEQQQKRKSLFSHDVVNDFNIFYLVDITEQSHDQVSSEKVRLEENFDLQLPNDEPAYCVKTTKKEGTGDTGKVLN